MCALNVLVLYLFFLFVCYYCSSHLFKQKQQTSLIFSFFKPQIKPIFLLIKMLKPHILSVPNTHQKKPYMFYYLLFPKKSCNLPVFYFSPCLPSNPISSSDKQTTRPNHNLYLYNPTLKP